MIISYRYNNNQEEFLLFMTIHVAGIPSGNLYIDFQTTANKNASLFQINAALL